MAAVAPEAPISPRPSSQPREPAAVDDAAARAPLPAFDENTQRELVGVDTGTLDNIGLITAFISAIAVGLLATPSYDDLLVADELCFNSTYWGGCGNWYWDAEHYVSHGFAYMCAFTSSFSFAAVLCAIVVRSTLPLLSSLDQQGREKIGTILRPLVILSVVFLIISLQTCTLCMYFLGHIVFGPQFAGGPGWMFAGGWFMIASAAISALMIYLKVSLIKRLRKEAAEKRE